MIGAALTISRIFTTLFRSRFRWIPPDPKAMRNRIAQEEEEEEVDRLTDFVATQYEPAKTWPRKITRGFIAWNIGNGFLGFVRGEFDEVVGLAVCRPVMEPADGLVAYRFDPEGKVIFVDLFIACSPRARLALSYIFRHRFGEREQVAYYTKGKLRIHAYKALVRNIDRGKNEVIREYYDSLLGI